MKKDLANFTIEYDKEVPYLDELIAHLEDKTLGILDFFNLANLPNKKRIIIYTDREKYKEHMISCIGYFYDWMCGDTNDGNINVLDIFEARKSEEHSDMTMDDLKQCIVHEFVHAAQQEINPSSSNVEWFWEALATNLSSQSFSKKDLNNCDFNKLVTDFNNTENGYNYAFELGQFMLDNYSKETILGFVKDPKSLKEQAPDIFKKATMYQKEKNK